MQLAPEKGKKLNLSLHTVGASFWLPLAAPTLMGLSMVLLAATPQCQAKAMMDRASMIEASWDEDSAKV